MPPQHPNQSLPPLPGTEWDPDNPGQLRRIQKPARGTFQPTGLPGVTGTFDPNKPSEVRAAQQAIAPAVVKPEKPKPLENIIKIPVRAGSKDSVEVKIGDVQDLVALDALTAKRKVRSLDATIDKEKEERITRLEDRYIDLVTKRDQVSTDPVTLESNPKFDRATMDRAVVRAQKRYQKAVGTDGLPTVGGAGLPGSSENPYNLTDPSQIGALPEGDRFVGPDGIPRVKITGEGPKAKADEGAKVEPKPKPKPITSGGIPEKKEEPKADDKDAAPAGLPKVERRKITIRIGKLTKELRTATEDSKPRLRKEIAKLKAQLKTLGG